MGEQPRSGAPAGNRMRGSGGLGNRLAGTAGELLPHVLDYLSTAAVPPPASRSHPRRSCASCRRSTDRRRAPDTQSARAAGGQEADGAPACAVQNPGAGPCRSSPGGLRPLPPPRLRPRSLQDRQAEAQAVRSGPPAPRIDRTVHGAAWRWRTSASRSSAPAPAMPLLQRCARRARPAASPSASRHHREANHRGSSPRWNHKMPLSCEPTLVC